MFLEVSWTDPVTGCHGYLVVDRLVRGVASGGLRMRPGCTLGEVRGLAEGMSRKEALNYDPAGRYVPLGGAKGGIDFDPRDERARGVIERYLRAMRPLIEQYWTMGEDLGVRQDDIDEVLAELGVSSSVVAVHPLLDDLAAAKARLAAAFEVQVGGVGLDELVGGLGVAEAVVTALGHLRLPVEGSRAVVQGFGSMGGATARFLAEAGVRVVGIADVQGLVVDEGGLDVEHLLAHRDRFGAIDRAHLCPGAAARPADEWLKVPAEVLVPAAVSYCVDADNEHLVTAKVVVEAANLPVTADAEARLAARGIPVVPDFTANSATNSWWWWTFFGDIGPTADEAFAQVRTRLRHLVTTLFTHSNRHGTTLREAAQALCDANAAAIEARFGDDAA
ncbi:Glu/Leu/Phe/Val dehydrogenase dimerization domain-containing protein [Amycolatopsis sp. NPDC051903]|uniref:Glu/Leu/Phe/Val dehydrogenase dimerization domain-containing protein n=1 Tax=Amycolatopsis sp. NPDC051903 TaxID=3363936 RepID=UPI0037BCC992